jgi:hypothetical protein
MLTPMEILLASRIDFDENVLRLVKGALSKDIEPYELGLWFDGSEMVIPADEATNGKGFTVKLADAYDDTWHLDKIYQVRGLLPYGYLAFLTEDFRDRPGLTVLKTSDPYEIIRVQKTQGWDFKNRNYWIEDIIQVLMKWQKQCSMDLVGADRNNVKLILETLPEDLLGFAEEVNFLCYELDQVNDFGDYSDDPEENRIVAEKLAASLRETRRLYLWWD